MQLFAQPNIDLISRRKIGYFISLALLIIGLGSLVFRGGPKYGVDFLGGVSIHVKFNTAVEVDAIRSSMSEIGFGNAEIKKSVVIQNGVEIEEFIIRLLSSVEGGLGDVVLNKLNTDFGQENVEVLSNDSVGPKIGGELRRAAIYAILLSLFFILIYVSWRFELRFAIGAIVPLFHDVLITLGVFALLNYEITLPVVAAFLTIVGYSLNDTIVVFDRVRENLKTLRRETYNKIVNTSINETLSRTVITSLTTLFVVAILFIFGGDVIHSFAFALLVGIVIGTYSSIFVASPILIEWENRKVKRGGASSTGKSR